MHALSPPAKSAIMSPARSDGAIRLMSRVIDVLNSRPLRRLSELCLTGLLHLRRVLPRGPLDRLLRWYLAADSPCAGLPDTPSRRFVRWFFQHFGEKTMRRAQAFVNETPAAQAARRLDRFLRLLVVAELRAIARYFAGRCPTPESPLLNQAQLALYPHCDLSCHGCYTQEDRQGQPPSRADVAWMIDEAESCGAYIIHVVGKGEPFLSPSWAEGFLDVMAARPHLFFTVVTHGMRITPQQAARLGRLGNVLILVSIDGPAELHDARRGPGSYARVQQALSLLRQHGVFFGFSTTVTAQNHGALTQPAFVDDLVAAGCSVGMYSRYFPLSPAHRDTLQLSPTALADYQRAFTTARDQAPIPLLDLDDIEQATGCHSRFGESVHIDGVSGSVTPCIRVPFAPADCRLDRAAGRGLSAILAHEFFVDYRKRRGPCPSWCGADLQGELIAVERILDAHGGASPRLADYRERSPAAAEPVRLRLPIVSSSPR